MVEGEADAHILNELTGGFYLLRFIFFGDMPVKADGELYARFFHDFLLRFILKKFGDVRVLLKGV